MLKMWILAKIIAIILVFHHSKTSKRQLFLSNTITNTISNSKCAQYMPLLLWSHVAVWRESTTVQTHIILSSSSSGVRARPVPRRHPRSGVALPGGGDSSATQRRLGRRRARTRHLCWQLLGRGDVLDLESLTHVNGLSFSRDCWKFDNHWPEKVPPYFLPANIHLIHLVIIFLAPSPSDQVLDGRIGSQLQPTISRTIPYSGSNIVGGVVIFNM